MITSPVHPFSLYKTLIIWLLLTPVCLARTIVVNGQTGQDRNTGTSTRPLKTIQRAANLAGPGDLVLIHGGIYREWVRPVRSGRPGQPITFQAAPHETVVLKGSEVFRGRWQAEGKAVYSASLAELPIGQYNPFRIRAVRLANGTLHLGQVFVNGTPLTEVGAEAEVRRIPGSFWVADTLGTSLRVHFPPGTSPTDDPLVELTVRERIFAPATRLFLSYITLRNLQFEHAANQFPSGFYAKGGHLQHGAVGTGAGHHWTLEHCTIHHARSLGLDIGTEGYFAPDQPKPDTTGYHLVRYCTISDNGACGLAGFDNHHTRILHNTLERNNNLGWTAPETGGMKLHLFYDGIIEGNLLRDNDASGIWLDNVWYGSRVSRNVVLGSTGSGIFIEMGDGPCLVDHNLVAYTRQGDGIYTHDASGVTVAHNLLYANAHFGVYMRIVTERKARRADGQRVVVGTHDQQVRNNVFIDNMRGHICLPGPVEGRVYNNQSDYNLLISGTMWQWEGLGLHKFVVNRNGDGDRTHADSLTTYLTRSSGTENAGDNPFTTSRWRDMPYLTLMDWQRLGYDQNSLAPPLDKTQVENGAATKGAVSLSPNELAIQFTNGSLLNTLRCPPVAGADHDFYGEPVDKKSVLPGPFATVPRGFVRFSLKTP